MERRKKKRKRFGKNLWGSIYFGKNIMENQVPGRKARKAELALENFGKKNKEKSIRSQKNCEHTGPVRKRGAVLQHRQKRIKKGGSLRKISQKRFIRGRQRIGKTIQRPLEAAGDCIRGKCWRKKPPRQVALSQGGKLLRRETQQQRRKKRRGR